MTWLHPRSCSVVDSIECQAPPGYERTGVRLASCYQCGDDVCRACSSLVKKKTWNKKRTHYAGTRVRMCFTCIGGSPTPTSEKGGRGDGG